MKSCFSEGHTVRVTAAANRTVDIPVIEQGLFGFPTSSPLINTEYALMVEPGEYLISTDGTNLNTPAKGDLVYCTSNNVLTKTASTNRLVGVLTRVTGDEGVPSGKLVMYLYPVHREAHIHGLSVVEEASMTVTTDVGALPSACLALLSVHGTVSAAEVHFKIGSKSITPATGECKVDYGARTVTFYGSDDPTAVKISYISNVTA